MAAVCEISNDLSEVGTRYKIDMLNDDISLLSVEPYWFKFLPFIRSAFECFGG